MTLKKTILCVDDEHSLSIEKIMLETRGYRVMTCKTALEALDVFQRCSVDLVLSNLELPDTTANELVTGLKSCSPQLPVILLSNHRRIFHTDVPADLLLRKESYAPAELLESIRILLTKRRGPRRSQPMMAQRAQAS
jgi:DNA-binding response OmpR family regulator